MNLTHKEWLDEVAKIMKNKWCLDKTEWIDSTREDDHVHWKPEEWCSWFAEKYDLISFDDFFPIFNHLNT